MRCVALRVRKCKTLQFKLSRNVKFIFLGLKYRLIDLSVGSRFYENLPISIYFFRPVESDLTFTNTGYLFLAE